MTKKVRKSNGRGAKEFPGGNKERGILEIMGSEGRVGCLELVAQSMAYVDEAISLTDLEQNRFLHVNPAWVRLYGYPAKKVMGERVESLINMPDISRRILRTIKTQTCNGGWEGCLLNRNSKGNVFMVNLRTGCLTDSDGELLAMLGVATPTENKIGNGKGASSKTGKSQGKSKKGLSLEELGQLTPREVEVFTLFGQGFDTRQVSAKLGISSYTVQTYRNHLKEKLNATTTAQLNFLAYQCVGNKVVRLD